MQWQRILGKPILDELVKSPQYHYTLKIFLSVKMPEADFFHAKAVNQFSV